VNKTILLFLLFGICFIFSCEQADSGPKSLLNLVLVDTPAKWDSVLVEIEGVELEILVQGRETESQIFYLEYKTGDKQIRVSDLIGGQGLIIGREQLPAGKVIGLRVQMGKNHMLYQEKKGYALPLVDPNNVFVPLVAELDLEAGIAYDVILDMDLEKSILQKTTSPLSFQLAPFFTLIEGASSGELQGTVSPLTLKPAIFLIQGTDSISTHPTTSGGYLFRADPGNYSLYFDPKDVRYVGETVSNVIIEERKTTNVPVHTFKIKP
jgi:hypothetical protein